MADQPVPTATLATVLGVATSSVGDVLVALQAEYDGTGRGFELREVAGGWRLYTSQRFAELVERFVVEEQQSGLSRASLETLAVIAYRQPVTRGRVAAIRGVGVDGVFRSLLSRGLIEECGDDRDAGAHLYRVTEVFLEHFGLKAVSELPSLAPLLPETDEWDELSTST
ncbi:MAG: SMC-Scp complex subunit ScpB [Actinomycetota bacterium]|nr:SMC-Scp complex subunit ScpB [Actinomycetota bacterium]